MQNNPNPLEQLKDLHYPEAITELPIAIGWWLLLLIGFICLAFFCYFSFVLVKKNQYRRHALKQLTIIFSKNENDKQLLFNINNLLKKTAFKQYPISVCGSLSGAKWQAFLLLTLPAAKKENVEKFNILNEIYQLDIQLTDNDRKQLKKDASLWIRKHLTNVKLAKQLSTKEWINNV